MSAGARFWKVDLHLHTFGESSCVTDIDMTPANVIKRAVDEGISLLAITNHNSGLHIEETMELARKSGRPVTVLPGVEISAVGGHLLAIFPETEPGQVSKLLAKLDARS